VPRPSSRPQIVEAALTEFHRLGFNGCSVDTITKAAGVPKGSFYNHFPGKEELAAEVVALYISRSPFRAERDDDLGPLAELRARFVALGERHQAHDFARGCLIMNLGSEIGSSAPLVRTALDEAFDGWAARAAALLRRAQEAREISLRMDPDRYARFIIDAWEGAVTRAKVEHSWAPFDDFFACTLDAIATAPAEI
jgi:TetR/AcrR family transcriptional regulator, transcriptional repressor for nem operon